MHGYQAKLLCTISILFVKGTCDEIHSKRAIKGKLGVGFDHVDSSG